MKRLMRWTIVVACLITAVSSVQAITVNWAAQGAALANYDGNGPSTSPALQGDLIQIGTFNFNADFNLNNQAIMAAASAGNLSLLQQNFTPFRLGAVGQGLPFDGVWSIATDSPAGTFATQQIYLWTFNASTIPGATQWGIYTSSDSSWRFPTEDPPASTSIDLNQVLQAGGVILAGEVGGIIDFGFPLPSVEMVPIPEPSSLVLVGLGVGSLALIRRRRKP